MGSLRNWLCCGAGSLLVAGGVLAQNAPATNPPAAEGIKWVQTGWGGGGFYWAAAFHPTREGVLFLAGDVNGVYKSEDHGQNFRMVNKGLLDYGVYGLAVDPSTPDTIYAATVSGLCKSTDAGETWRGLGKPGDLRRRLSGQRNKSIRSVAVDPSNSNNVYVASPFGGIYKSADGGETWNAVYQKSAAAGSEDLLQVTLGKSSDAYFGGFWFPVQAPAAAKAEQISGLTFKLQTAGASPERVYVTVRDAQDQAYISKNLHDVFARKGLLQVTLEGDAFAIDPEFAKKKPEAAKAMPATPDWSKIARIDISAVGDLPGTAYKIGVGEFSYAMKGDASPVVFKDFDQDKTVYSYGNVKIAAAAAAGKTPDGEPVHSVAVAHSEPSLVVAGTSDEGVLLSNDAGKTWRALETPKQAKGVAIYQKDASIMYGAFAKDGVWKTTDKGSTWTQVSKGLAENFSAVEIAISPSNPNDVYVIGGAGWGGRFYFSHDGGVNWTQSSDMKADLQGNPTGPDEGGVRPLSAPTNLAMNPNNPNELYISGNWRCGWSGDAGKSWEERDRGADISCVYDVRFLDGKTYVTVMDEGTLASDDNGKSWRALWPRRHDKRISGHNWRVAVNNINGVHRVISTCSPWDDDSNRIIRSEDGGKTMEVVEAGLPDYYPKKNTMWEKGYARALAVDPKNPDIVYLGIDGEPEGDKMGGGIFKSIDGGKNWQQLPNQPGSRRMFFGLVVDPTDSNRLFWASCSTSGGLYRSEDAGQSWERVHKGTEWAFNVHVGNDGTVYTPGKELFKSTDHGKTFKQITNFVGNRDIVAMESHPTDPNTFWFGVSTWSGEPQGAVYQTTDGGATWQEITADLPYNKPMVLRFNPTTNELWAGGVGLYRLTK